MKTTAAKGSLKIWAKNDPKTEPRQDKAAKHLFDSFAEAEE